VRTPFILDLIDLVLKEDVGIGDITSSLLIPEGKSVKAEIIAKEDFLLAGMPFVKEIFSFINEDIRFDSFFKDGDWVKNKTVIANISGNGRDILAGERIALNILQNVSGIATLTNQFVKKVEGLSVKIADTRKTLPGMRLMQKYGVRIGGGINHRFGLFDGILIKDNHIKIVGSLRRAVELSKKGHHLLKVEVEVKNIDEFKEALEAGADVIMLDNMSIKDMKEAVKMRNKRIEKSNNKVLLEASGGINLENIREIAETGIDIISIGALTHSARAVDISMKVI
jgi:nicotinate-nucleotide pyrophosphorylase (carboxylating)